MTFTDHIILPKLIHGKNIVPQDNFLSTYCSDFLFLNDFFSYTRK